MRARRMRRTMLVEEQSTGDRRCKTMPPKLPPKADLRNIIELTEQNEPNPAHQPAKESSDPHEPDSPAPSLTQKYLGCIAALCKNIFRRPPKLEIDTADTDLASIIQKIRSRKEEPGSLLPAQRTPKRVLVLDLDETLIHTTFTRPAKFDFELEVVFNGRSTKMFTVKRFGLDAFLFEMSRLYEIVIFTASQRLYASRIIDLIDPKHRVAHRLYREHCRAVNKTYFLKDIRTLGRPAKDIVIVDDNNVAGLLQPENFFKIDPFEGSEKDRQLCRLSAFLKHLHEKEQMGSVREAWREFEDMEINLSDREASSCKSSINETKTLIQKKKPYINHKKRNSEIESLATKSTEEENEGEISASDFIKKL